MCALALLIYGYAYYEAPVAPMLVQPFLEYLYNTRNSCRSVKVSLDCTNAGVDLVKLNSELIQSMSRSRFVKWLSD